MSKQESIGFIGIGLMGKPMTLRLVDAGYTVRVWNRSADKLSDVCDRGAIAVDSASTVIRESDITLLSLADTAAVEEVIFGDTDWMSTIDGNGKTIVDLSSIDPAKTREFADRLADRCGIEWVDAPVSGGVAGATQGTLAIMAGGNEASVEKVRPVLEHLGQRTTHMGPSGSGQVTKICNQMIVSCNAMVIAEMTALAQQAGVDAEKIPTALGGGFADSKPLQILGPEMATRTFEPVKWKVRTLLKDLNMAVDLSRTTEKPVPMSGLAAQLMQLHAANGFLDHDPATLIKLYSD